jgi:hypothetical protein
VGLDASPAKTDDRGFWAGQVIAGRSWPFFGSCPFTVTKGTGSETLECSNGTCGNRVIVAASALVRTQAPSEGRLALDGTDRGKRMRTERTVPRPSQVLPDPDVPTTAIRRTA